MPKINIHINKYITESTKSRDLINQLVIENKKILMMAAMGSGKTTWLFDDLKSYAEDNDMSLVIVNPSVAQLKQLEYEYKVYCVCEGRNYNEESIVTTTPDSLPKIIKKLKDKPFILVVDEAHEIYTSVKFRKAFENIKRYEDLANKIIYMTATPKPLIFDKFDCIVNIIKPQKPIKASIMLVESLNIDTIANVIEKRLEHSEVVCIHNNNKKENEEIGNYFTSKLKTTNKVLLEEHQENLLGYEAHIDYKKLNKVSVLNAQSKDHKEYKNLIHNSTLLDDTSLFISTSFIKAGMNINNTKNTSVIVVCDSSGYNYVNEIQTIGRYRDVDKIDEVIFLIKEIQNVKGIQYSSFETIYDSKLSTYTKLVNVLNDDLSNITHPSKINLSSNINYDLESNRYTLNTQNIIAESIEAWANDILKFPYILKKELEHEEAVNLNVHITKHIQNEQNTILSDKLKENVKATKEQFKECLKQILTYDDFTLSEVIGYTVDQRRAENREVVENMKILRDLMPQSWNKLYKQIIKDLEMDQIEAFRLLATQKHTTIRKEIKAKKVKEYNVLIKALGLDKAIKDELTYKAAKDTKDFAMQIRIRKELLEIELKRSSISKVKIVALINTLKELKYISDKTSEKKAYEDTIEMLEMIYNISPRNGKGKYIESLKY